MPYPAGTSVFYLETRARPCSCKSITALCRQSTLSFEKVTFNCCSMVQNVDSNSGHLGSTFKKMWLFDSFLLSNFWKSLSSIFAIYTSKDFLVYPYDFSLHSYFIEVWVSQRFTFFRTRQTLNEENSQ